MQTWSASNHALGIKMLKAGRKIWPDRLWYITNEGCLKGDWLVVSRNDYPIERFSAIALSLPSRKKL